MSYISYTFWFLNSFFPSILLPCFFFFFLLLFSPQVNRCWCASTHKRWVRKNAKYSKAESAATVFQMLFKKWFLETEADNLSAISMFWNLAVNAGACGWHDCAETFSSVFPNGLTHSHLFLLSDFPLSSFTFTSLTCTFICCDMLCHITPRLAFLPRPAASPASGQLH